MAPILRQTAILGATKAVYGYYQARCTYILVAHKWPLYCGKRLFWVLQKQSTDTIKEHTRGDDSFNPRHPHPRHPRHRHHPRHPHRPHRPCRPRRTRPLQDGLLGYST